jgi:hypothetical protein
MLSPMLKFMIFLRAALDFENEVRDELTSELIDAAVIFVEIASRSEKNMDKRVYYNTRGNTISSSRLRSILDHTWLTDDVSDISAWPLIH